MRLFLRALALLILALSPAAAQVQGGGSVVTINNPASPQNIAVVTRPANTTAYTGNQLIAHNTTGSVTPTQITITGKPGGSALAIAAHAETSYTGASAPPEQDWFVFSGAPTVTNLIDGSAYVGPYAADLTGGVYLGRFICASWAKTNDATAQWFTPCSWSGLIASQGFLQAVSGQTYVDMLLATVGSGYTPVSGEAETFVLSTMPN